VTTGLGTLIFVGQISVVAGLRYSRMGRTTVIMPL
jgi:hypothetical protein